MAKTTAYTASAIARLLALGMNEAKGVDPPEELGRQESSFLFITEELSERNARIQGTCHL
jgi:saccharopine dehydrogenase-like NADP-dependent oxidoreductase